MWACAAALVLALAGGAAAADKVDVIHFKNGDRLTCEIKNLDRSVLTISTDPLGSASVHWGEVADLLSPRLFDVQLASGEHFLGSLAASAPGQMVLQFVGGGTGTVPLTEVIRMAPIGTSIWNRINGSVDAGFSFAQADLETHWTLNGAATYRSPRYELDANIASQVTARQDESSISRNSIGFNWNRSFGNHWYTIGWGQLQQNQELALDLRVVLGGGVGRDVVHTTRRLWSIYGGAAYTNEKFSGEPVAQSAEAAIGGQLDFFTPGTTDYKITNSVVAYINMTGRGRLRLEQQSAWRHEFLKDFYWSLNGFDSFDGDPPDDQKKNDFGVSFTLGWKF
ncbi:MAG TPA: DUF481 domain-containing protein [Vicinamibacterales bacterium]